MGHIDLARLEERHAAHVVIHLGKPLGISLEEVVDQRAVELRSEEIALDLGRVLGEALSDDVLEAGGQEQEQQVELAQRLIDELARAATQRQEIDAQLVLGQGILIGRCGQRIAVRVGKLTVRHTCEIQRSQCADKFDEMGIIALAMFTRVIQVGLAAHLVAQVIDAVHIAIVGTSERVLVVVERALGLDDEVAGSDALILLVSLKGEIGQHGQASDGSAAQRVTVLDALKVGRLADIFDHDGEARCTRAAKNGTDEENAVTLAEDVAEGLELVAVLDFVQRHTTDIRAAHKADVHLVLQLVVGKQE